MIPFLDLKAQYKSIEGEVKKAVEKIFEDCAFVGGKEVETFEKTSLIIATRLIVLVSAMERTLCGLP
jgi:dTDP-4-amino-4,6-dideoxygalactose transaminase